MRDNQYYTKGNSWLLYVVVTAVILWAVWYLGGKPDITWIIKALWAYALAIS